MPSRDLEKAKETWIDIMMLEELGIVESDKSPINNAIATFLSFGIFGFIPLLAYVTSCFLPALAENAFPLAGILTGMTLFALRTLKVRITEKNWLRSGAEMLLVGGIAAIAAYAVGLLLAGLAGRPAHRLLSGETVVSAANPSYKETRLHERQRGNSSHEDGHSLHSVSHG